MKKVTFSKDFKYSPDGFTVIEYNAHDTKEVDDECAKIASDNGYLAKAKTAPKNKAR